jgi:hypothetical protein
MAKVRLAKSPFLGMNCGAKGQNTSVIACK